MLAQEDRPRWLRISRSPWPYLVAAAALAALALNGILSLTAGSPAVPLDDSYIHFQFARSLAQGHPFVYSPGSAPVAGATSLLWPLLLAVPQWFGVQGAEIIPWAWGFGFLSLGLLAYETARAADRICSEQIAWMAGLLVLAFSANTWFAASGMEVVPLAWLLMRCARRAAEWLELDRRRPWELGLLACAAPALRPEGALGTLLLASAVFFGSKGRKRLLALPVLGFVALPPLVYELFTGHVTQTTTQVKWLPFSPYLTRSDLWQTVVANARLLFSTLLDGRAWGAEYIPEHSGFFAALALAALIFAGQARRASARAWLVLVLALGMLLPTTYDSFLWNRLRYLWPFASPWLIGLVALSDQLGEGVCLFSTRLGVGRYILAALVALALGCKLPFALSDLADSARAIESQQVALGIWAKHTLPPNARIGVNDTGAIAYYSGHPIFDVVGLTTAGEARYWSAGAGSRFEHYEHLPRNALPSHFIVYPGWFAIPQLLGPCLTERTVYASILGGETMVACVADYSWLGSGERPAAPEFWQRQPIDTLDVADLESEAAHRYELLPATQADNLVLSDGVIADGARKNRQHESFEFELLPSARFVARLGAAQALIVTVRVRGQAVARWSIAGSPFHEYSVRLPSDVRAGRAVVELSADEGAFSAAHYWLYRAE